MYKLSVYETWQSETETEIRSRQLNFFPTTSTYIVDREFITITRDEEEEQFPGYTLAEYKFSTAQDDLTLTESALINRAETKIKAEKPSLLVDRLNTFSHVQHYSGGEVTDFDVYRFYFECKGILTITAAVLNTIPNKALCESLHKFDTVVSIKSLERSICLTGVNIDADVIRLTTAKRVTFKDCVLNCKQISINGVEQTALVNLLNSVGFSTTINADSTRKTTTFDGKGKTISIDAFTLQCICQPDIDRETIKQTKQSLADLTSLTWRYSNTQKLFWCTGPKQQIKRVKEQLKSVVSSINPPKRLASTAQDDIGTYCLRLSNDQCQRLLATQSNTRTF